MAPFHTQEEVVVGLVNVNDSEPVDFCVPGFFENHYINNSPPSVKGVGKLEGVVEECELCLDESFSFHIKGFGGIGVRFVFVSSEEGVVVA